MLPLLDYPCIAAHPKPLIGFSDVTSLHLAIAQRCGLVTFHGPMASWTLGREQEDFTWHSLCSALEMAVQDAAIPELAQHPLQGVDLLAHVLQIEDAAPRVDLPGGAHGEASVELCAMGAQPRRRVKRSPSQKRCKP